MSARDPSLLTPDFCDAQGLAFALEPHPEIPQVPVEALLAAGVTYEEVLGLLAERHATLAPMYEKSRKNPMGDPLRYGWEPPSWRIARELIETMRAECPFGVLQLLILGGWRSTKTEFLCKMFMEIMVQKPGSRGWFLQDTEDASKARQQPRLWKYMPNEWKNIETGRMKKAIDTKLAYAQGTGFTGNKFVLPNIGRNGQGSEAEGKFYKATKESLQGEELDVAAGDELMPKHILATLLGRLFNRNGLLMLGFTPLDGFTDTVAHWFEGVEFKNDIPVSHVTRWADAELLPRRDAAGAVIGCEQVPVVLRGEDPLKAVVWFHTKGNPYGNYPGLVQLLRRASRGKILVEAYGVATRKFGAVFQFRATNVVDDKTREEILRNAKDYTFYMEMDPAGTGAARNPFAQWWAVAKNGQRICVREWPQPGDYIPGIGDANGTWAVWGEDAAEESGKKSAADGRRGPAQEWFGLGMEGLSGEFRRVEEELASFAAKNQHPTSNIQKEPAAAPAPRLKVRYRFMDSRAGNSSTITSGGAVTLIQMWDELPEPHRLYFLPASGRQTAETGESWKLALQSMLEVNGTIGAPQVMVCSCCQNTIDALKNWTGLDGNEGACKDPVDCTKMFILEDAPWVSADVAKEEQQQQWGGYGGRR